MSESIDSESRLESGVSDPARTDEALVPTRHRAGDAGPDRDAAIVAAYAAGETATSLAERHGVSASVVYAAIRASSESDLRERHVVARVALDRAALAERARAYAAAHPDFVLGDAYAALAHRPRDHEFLRGVLDEAARAAGRSSVHENRRNAARAAEIVAARAAGETFTAIGARHRLSRDRVRRIVEAMGPETTEAVALARAARETEDAARVASEEEARLAGVASRLLERAEATGERTLVDTPELRAATGLRTGDPARLRPLLRDVVVTRRSATSGRVFSDESLLLALREVAATLGGEALTGAS